MFLDDGQTVYDVYKITSEEKRNIKAFLQGGVYCWCKNRKKEENEWFSLRDLMGGDNFHWQGTPLMKLYDKHQNKEDATKLAGKDAGWLLKAVIKEDKRIFETKVDGRIRQYRWVNTLQNDS